MACNRDDRVNSSFMSGSNSLSVVVLDTYLLTLIAMQGQQAKQKDKRHGEPGLQLAQFVTPGSRIGWVSKEIYNAMMHGCTVEQQHLSRCVLIFL